MLWSLPAAPTQPQEVGHDSPAKASGTDVGDGYVRCGDGSGHEASGREGSESGRNETADDEDDACSLQHRQPLTEQRDEHGEPVLPSSEPISDVAWALIEGRGWVCVHDGQRPDRCGAVIVERAWL